jgi:hypothetical protein
MQNLAPIALFVYNRPDHTGRTLNFLQQNVLAKDSRLFIFSDAAKTQKDQDKVNEVRELIKDVKGFHSVEVIERDNNLGLANSIINGVTRLVKEFGTIIVLEDDLVTSPYTLQYFNDALEKYAAEDKVMHIGAYMYPLKASNLPETFFYRIATSWGWATWERAWNNFQPDIEALMDDFDKQKINDFSLDGTMNFWKQMLEFRSGKNNSWAIRWYASIFLKGGLSLNPSQSLINNIGHDGSGIHSGINDIYNVIINPNPVTDFPEQIEENKMADGQIKEFLKTRKGSLWTRILRLARQKFS